MLPVPHNAYYSPPAEGLFPCLASPAGVFLPSSLDCRYRIEADSSDWYRDPFTPNSHIPVGVNVRAVLFEVHATFVEDVVHQDLLKIRDLVGHRVWLAHEPYPAGGTLLLARACHLECEYRGLYVLRATLVPTGKVYPLSPSTYRIPPHVPRDQALAFEKDLLAGRDPTTALIYADWLEEHDWPDRALALREHIQFPLASVTHE